MSVRITADPNNPSRVLEETLARNADQLRSAVAGLINITAVLLLLSTPAIVWALYKWVFTL